MTAVFARRAATAGLCVAMAACSGGKRTQRTVVEDARATALAPADAAVSTDPTGKGDVQVRVEWKGVPAAARAAPGRTPCGTERPAAVAPNVLWGIPEVFVAIDAPGSGAAKSARIAYTSCALSPRVAVTTGSLSIASGSEAPIKATVLRAGSLPLGSALSGDKPRDVYLPTAGHEVSVPAEHGALYRVTVADEVSWIVATESPYVGVTENSGNLVLRDVPAGTHAVSAWLPARSGQSARVAHGKVTVKAGALAEVTLDITKQ